MDGEIYRDSNLAVQYIVVPDGVVVDCDSFSFPTDTLLIKPDEDPTLWQHGFSDKNGCRNAVMVLRRLAEDGTAAVKLRLTLGLRRLLRWRYASEDDSQWHEERG